MIKIIADLIKDNANIDDKVIADSMMSTAKAGALLYLDATKTSTTPELRALYTAAVAQMLQGDACLTELAIKKQWIKPYELSVSQLQCAFNCANNTVNKKQ